MLETSAFKLFTVANLRFKSVDNTKLPCYTFPPTQHHSFFRNLFSLLHIVSLYCFSFRPAIDGISATILISFRKLLLSSTFR